MEDTWWVFTAETRNPFNIEFTSLKMDLPEKLLKFTRHKLLIKMCTDLSIEKLFTNLHAYLLRYLPCFKNP